MRSQEIFVKCQKLCALKHISQPQKSLPKQSLSAQSVSYIYNTVTASPHSPAVSSGGKPKPLYPSVLPSKPQTRLTKTLIFPHRKRKWLLSCRPDQLVCFCSCVDGVSSVFSLVSDHLWGTITVFFFLLKTSGVFGESNATAAVSRRKGPSEDKSKAVKII